MNGYGLTKSLGVKMGGHKMVYYASFLGSSRQFDTEAARDAYVDSICANAVYFHPRRITYHKLSVLPISSVTMSQEIEVFVPAPNTICKNLFGSYETLTLSDVLEWTESSE